MSRNYKIKFRANGKVESVNLNHKRLRKANLKKAVRRTIIDYLKRIKEVTEETMQDQIARIEARPLVSQEETALAEAYKQALDASEAKLGYKRLSLKMIDYKLLDKLLPVSVGTANKQGGWWRIHEFGVGGKVGGSDTHGFVSNEFLQKIFGDKYNPTGHQRHGEGLMIRRESKLGRMLDIKPHPGVKPLRIIANTRLEIKPFAKRPFGIMRKFVTKRFVSG